MQPPKVQPPKAPVKGKNPHWCFHIFDKFWKDCKFGYKHLFLKIFIQFGSIFFFTVVYSKISSKNINIITFALNRNSWDWCPGWRRRSNHSQCWEESCQEDTPLGYRHRDTELHWQLWSDWWPVMGMLNWFPPHICLQTERWCRQS